MKLKHKLTLLFIIPVLLVGTLSISMMLWSRENFKNTVVIDSQKSQLSLEMEVSDKKAVKSILDYITTQEAEHYVAFRDAIGEFSFKLQKFSTLPLSENEKEELHALEQHYGLFKASAEALADAEKDQIYYLAKANASLNEGLDSLFDEQWGPYLKDNQEESSKKGQALLELELNGYELLEAIKSHILNSTEDTKMRISDSLADIKQWLIKLESLPLSPEEKVWMEALKAYFEDFKVATDKIVVLEDEKSEKLFQIRNLEKEIDYILIKKIQEPAIEDLLRTKDAVVMLNAAASLGILGFLMAATFMAIWFIKNYFSKPVDKLKEVAEQIASGDTRATLDEENQGEFGELYPSFVRLIESSKTLSGAAEALGKGNFDTKIVARSDEDTLSQSLISMRDNLKQLDASNKKQMKIKSQVAEIIRSIQGEQDLKKVAQSFVSQLAEALEAGYGVLYFDEMILKDEVIDRERLEGKANDQTLVLLGTYGYEERKGLSSRIRTGEGLVGQCAFEKSMILLTEVPEDYIKISSGLGRETPLNIIVLPITHDDQLIGVIEIASFHRFTDSDITILKEVVASAGTIITNVVSHGKTQVLLEKAQVLNEEMTAQQEELRSSNEKLEEQTKALKQSEEELKSQSEELRVMNEELEEKTERLEQQKRELQGAQNDLELRAKDLALSSKYKSEFLANMSHELRTPLNSLLILSKKLSENREGNLTEKQVRSADIIHKGGKELLTLINDILDLSKVESGKLQVEIEPFQVNELCEEIRSQFEPLSQEKGIQFNVDVGADIPASLSSDQQRIIQILRNFISNAFKFTEQGSVTLKVRHPANALELGGKTFSPSDVIQFSVVDTGIGIPEHKQRIIFEAFQQAEGSTSRKYGGTGLGLAISRAMGSLLGGDIFLESREGQGSTFSLCIPLTYAGESSPSTPIGQSLETKPAVEKKELTPAPTPKAEPAVSPAPTTAEKPSRQEGGKGSLILIVDDEKDFLEVMTDFAQEQGYNTITATTGKEALSKAFEQKPQAIILDLGLPDMDGMEVLSQLKHDLRTRHVPVHVVSGREETPKAKKEGALGYLKKPASPDQVQDVFEGFESVIRNEIKNVLVVEDEVGNQEAISALIDSKKINLTIVDTGKAAYDHIQNKQADCVILDLNLPDMSGFDLLERLSRDNVSIPPIVVYTAREITEEENNKLQKYSSSIVLKGANSPNRLLDDVTLFLHSIQSDLSRESSQMIKMLHSGDSVLNGKKVLLVDDDMRNVFALSSELEEYAMDVVIASNGQQAVDKLKEQVDIDIVLMDIMMPVMDGYEAMEEIRKDRTFKELPIIALTAKAMTGDKEKCLKAGANDYISKPVDVEQLVSMMKVWVSH